MLNNLTKSSVGHVSGTGQEVGMASIEGKENFEAAKTFKLACQHFGSTIMEVGLSIREPTDPVPRSSDVEQKVATFA